MDAKLTSAQRVKLIKRALAGEPVAKICREVGISRVLFYRWIRRYKEEGKRGLAPKPFGRPRKAEARKKRPKPYPQLSPSQKLEMLERVTIGGEPVSKVAKEYGVSRTLFYRYKKRYEEAALEEKLEALKPKVPQVIRWARQTPEKFEQAVLSIVAKHPEYGIRRIVANLPKVAGSPVVGHHGVQNILRRSDLSTYEQRLAWAEAQVTPVTRVISATLEQVWRFFRIQPELRSRIIRTAGTFALSAFVVILVFGLGSYVARSLVPVPGASSIGMVFATIALFMGSVFFAYSLKYYLTLAVVLSFSQQEIEGIGRNGNGIRRGFIPWILGLANGNGNGRKNGKTGRLGPVGLEPNLERIRLKKHPKVSIHIPFYNEKNVVERAIAASTSFDYEGEYEVILADDSTDNTPAIIRDYQKQFLAKGERLKQTKGNGWTLTEIEVQPKVILKHLHRTSRSGFKGGALREALKHTDSEVEFIVVLDADFVPYPDTLELFLKYFKVQNNMSEDYRQSNVAAVQGYQWHVLNKSENWITKGVRSEYAGSYVIERSGGEIYGGLKQISGAVYMIRRDVLEEVGWETSITEDFQLTLKLYERGYKVVYTPYIQAPAECVSTLKRLIRQRMRWAEGHSNNIKHMFKRLMFNNKLTGAEKFEFVYLSPYYLQAFFFLTGTVSWLLSETVFPARLPFWTSLWGWSLVLTNLLSLPLMNAVGLFLEESEEKDYVGLGSFIALSYILVPFQAYASLKGFLEKEEGPWFRTPKTGKITDVFTRGKFYRFISGILPGRAPASAPVTARALQPAFLNKYVALATANNQFNSFSIKPKKAKWLGKVILSLLLVLSVSVYSATRGVPEVLATNWSNLYIHEDNAVCTTEDSMTTTIGSGPTQSITFSSTNTQAYYWYSPQLPTEGGDGNTGAGPWTFRFTGSFTSGGGGSWVKVAHAISLVDASNCANPTTEDVVLKQFRKTSDVPASVSIALTNNANTAITSSSPKRIRLRLQYDSDNKGATVTLDYDNSSVDVNDANLQPSTLTVPENVVIFAILTPLIPFLVSKWRKNRKASLAYSNA